MEKLYFVDGYHGGVEGHMPVGAWQDILDALKNDSGWKLSFDVEPSSWTYLKRHDREVWLELRRLISDNTASGRVEILNGSFAQPFCWAITGESNVRQLLRGAEIVKENFPEAKIDTYAVQEPCFTSALPQILKKLGFARMSLKNSTAWGGYMAKMDGSVVRLFSSDGTWLPAVVRYRCEELYDCCATVASGYDRKGIKTFASLCAENGVRAPLGMCLQDLGWRAHPFVDGCVEFVTYREYFSRFGAETDADVPFSQDDVLCSLPWGNPTLLRVAKSVRDLENRVLQAEKLLSVAEELAGPQYALRDTLKKVWDFIMLCQHHDAFICALGWQGRVAAWSSAARLLLDQVMNDGIALIDDSDCRGAAPENEIYIRVHSTLGNPATGRAELLLGLPRGFSGIRVYGPDGAEVLSQYTVQKARSFGYDENGVLLPSVPDKDRLYDDGSLEAVRLTFAASADGLGYKTFRAELQKEVAKPQRPLAKTSDDGSVEVDTSLLNLVFDPARGGSIVRFYDKKRKTDIAAGKPFGYLRGFFVERGGFLSTADKKASVEIAENGPYFTRLVIRSDLDCVSHSVTVEITEGEPRVDFHARAEFSRPVRIGHPYTPSPELAFSGVKRSHCNERYKLCVVMPVGTPDFRVFKSAPYDVCESFNKDTEFNAWTEIKHVMINPYLDLCGKDGGFAVHCDRLNGYSLKDGEFTLTLAFGHHSGFFWGDSPLSGSADIGYAIYSHSGDTFEGNTAYEFSKAEEPFIAARLPGRPGRPELSVFNTEDKNLRLVTVLNDCSGPTVRLFNASCSSSPLRYTCALSGFRGKKADLCGREAPDLDPGNAGKFEIITLK